MTAARHERLPAGAARDGGQAGAAAPAVPGPGAAAAVAHLQATAGNRAVTTPPRRPGSRPPLPWLLGGAAPRSRPGDDRRADPATMAEAEAEIAAKLAAQDLIAQIRRVRLGNPPGVGDPGGPDVISGADPRATP